MFSQEVMEMLIKGIGETLYMTLGATIFGYVLGLPMGIIMVTTSVLDFADFADAFDKGHCGQELWLYSNDCTPCYFSSTIYCTNG